MTILLWLGVIVVLPVATFALYFVTYLLARWCLRKLGVGEPVSSKRGGVR